METERRGGSPEEGRQCGSGSTTPTPCPTAPTADLIVGYVRNKGSPVRKWQPLYFQGGSLFFQIVPRRTLNPLNSSENDKINVAI